MNNTLWTGKKDFTGGPYRVVGTAKKTQLESAVAVVGVGVFFLKLCFNIKSYGVFQNTTC